MPVSIDFGIGLLFELSSSIGQQRNRSAISAESVTFVAFFHEVKGTIVALFDGFLNLLSDSGMVLNDSRLQGKASELSLTAAEYIGTEYIF